KENLAQRNFDSATELVVTQEKNYIVIGGQLYLKNAEITIKGKDGKGNQIHLTQSYTTSNWNIERTTIGELAKSKGVDISKFEKLNPEEKIERVNNYNYKLTMENLDGSTLIYEGSVNNEYRDIISSTEISIKLAPVKTSDTGEITQRDFQGNEYKFSYTATTEYFKDGYKTTKEIISIDGKKPTKYKVISEYVKADSEGKVSSQYYPLTAEYLKIVGDEITKGDIVATTKVEGIDSEGVNVNKTVIQIQTDREEGEDLDNDGEPELTSYTSKIFVLNGKNEIVDSETVKRENIRYKLIGGKALIAGYKETTIQSREVEAIVYEDKEGEKIFKMNLDNTEVYIDKKKDRVIFVDSQGKISGLIEKGEKITDEDILSSLDLENLLKEYKETGKTTLTVEEKIQLDVSAINYNGEGIPVSQNTVSSKTTSIKNQNNEELFTLTTSLEIKTSDITQNLRGQRWGYKEISQVRNEDSRAPPEAKLVYGISYDALDREISSSTETLSPQNYQTISRQINQFDSLENPEEITFKIKDLDHDTEYIKTQNFKDGKLIKEAVTQTIDGKKVSSTKTDIQELFGLTLSYNVQKSINEEVSSERILTVYDKQGNVLAQISHWKKEGNEYVAIQRENGVAIYKKDFQKNEYTGVFSQKVFSQTFEVNGEKIKARLYVSKDFENEQTQIYITDEKGEFIGSVKAESLIDESKVSEVSRKVIENTYNEKPVNFDKELIAENRILEVYQNAKIDLDNDGKFELDSIYAVFFNGEGEVESHRISIVAEIEGVGEARINIPVSYDEEKNIYYTIEKGAILPASTQGVLKHQDEQRNVEVTFEAIYEGDSFRLKPNSEFWAFYKKEGIDFAIKVVPEDGHFVPYLKDPQLSPRETADNLADVYFPFSLSDYISWKITACLLPDDEPTQLEMVASHRDSKVKIALSPNKDLTLGEIEAEIINKFEKVSTCSSEDKVINHFSSLAKDESFALSSLEFPGFKEEENIIYSRVKVDYTSKDWHATKTTVKEIKPNFEEGICPSIERIVTKWNSNGDEKREIIKIEGSIEGEVDIENRKIRLVKMMPITEYFDIEEIEYRVYDDNKLVWEDAFSSDVTVKLEKEEEGVFLIVSKWETISRQELHQQAYYTTSTAPAYFYQDDLVGDLSFEEINLGKEVAFPKFYYDYIEKEVKIKIGLNEDNEVTLNVNSVKGENDEQKFVQIGDTVFTTEEDIYKYPEFHHQEGLLQKLFGWTGEDLLSAPSTPGYLSGVRVTNGKDTDVIFRPSQESEIEEQMRIFRILRREDPVKAAILADFLIESSFWILQDKKYLEELESYRNTPEYELATQTREYQMRYSSMEKAASATKFRKTIFFVYPFWRISNGEDSWQDWEDFVNRISLPSEELGIVYRPQEQGYTVLDVGFDVITAVI
ncbi:MAG: hypothetical protein DRP81_04975, partial [Candidatus Omnitrophota bacterium]